MPATKLAVTTQPGTLPAGAGASHPYVAMVVQAQDAGSVRDTSYGVLIPGVGPDGSATTVSSSAGAATFSATPSNMFVGASILVASTWYTVATYNGTTGATLSGAPTFGASAWQWASPAGNPSDLTQPYATITLTTPGGAVISGSDKVAFLAGQATFSGVAVSLAGTYTYTITSSTGLTGTVSGSFTVSAVADTFFNPDNRLRGLGAALPRTVPSTTRPGTGTVRFVGPSDTYTTIQAAVNAAVGAGGLQTVKIRDAQTISEEVILPAYSGAGITITSETWTKTPGQRVAPSDFTTQAIWQPVNINGAVWKLPSGANNYWFVGLHVRTNPAVSTTSALALLGFDDGDPLAINAAGIPSGNCVDQCYLHHDDPTSAHTCARGIRWRSKNSAIVNSYFKGFQRTASPDAQSILCDNTPGNLLLDNNYIEGESEGFMIGGTDFLGADLVPKDVTVTRNYWTKPIAQLGVWQPKNLLEFKAGHRIKVEGNIFDGFWDSNVSQWSAINAKSVNQAQTAAQAYVGLSDLTIRHNFVRNVPDFMTCHGAPTPPVEIGSRIIVHNTLCANVNSTTWSTGGIGDGQFGHFASFYDAAWDHITFVSAPHASLLRCLAFGNVSGPTTRATFANILIQTDLGGTTAITGTGASPNMNGIIATMDPAAVFATNYYGGIDPGWVNYNTLNAPAGNLWVAQDGSLNAPDPGFTNYGIRSTAISADPLTICDAFVLASGVCKGTGTGGSDIGVKDMAALKTAITGVLLGIYGAVSGGTATQLAFTTEPSGATNGASFAIQPVVTVRDATSVAVTTATPAITLRLLPIAGAGELVGTPGLTAVAGVSAYSGIGVSASVGTFVLMATAPGLIPAVSTPFSIDSAVPTAQTNSTTQRNFIEAHNAAIASEFTDNWELPFNDPVTHGIYKASIAVLRAQLNAQSPHLMNSVTWDPPSLATGVQTTTTVTVTGAVLGAPVCVGFSLSLQGMQLTGYVSAANTVTVVLQNGTGGTVDLGSGILRTDVWSV